MHECHIQIYVEGRTQAITFQEDEQFVGVEQGDTEAPSNVSGFKLFS